MCDANALVLHEDVEGSIVGDDGDVKIGTIVLTSQPSTADKKTPRKKDRRYVYVSEKCTDRPYYLSKTRNRMFVVDLHRIDYFPDGEEPEETRKAMDGWPDNVGDVSTPEEVPVEEWQPQPDPKIGVIRMKVQKGSELLYDVPSEEGIIMRDVFCSRAGGRPYYYTQTGNKIFVVDQTRIILDHPPPPKKRKRPVLAI